MQFHEGDLQQIQPGMSQEQVRMNLGTPSTTAVVGNNQAFYYISSTATQTAFMLPTEQDRQVVAVYFSQAGTVDRVANYGMKDGRVFDYVSRTTPAPGGKDVGIVQQLFRNLGRSRSSATDPRSALTMSFRRSSVCCRCDARRHKH